MKYTARQRARGAMSDAAFKSVLPPQEREACDSDYAESLSEKDRLWLRTFQQEFYGGRFEKGGVVLQRGELKRECTRRLRRHRFDRSPDMMSAGAQKRAKSFEADPSLLEELYGSHNPEGGYLDSLDAEVFKQWKVKNYNSLREAKALFKNLTKTRNRLRLVKFARALVAREKVMNRYANGPGKQGHSDNTDEAYLTNRNSRLHQERLQSAEAWGVVASFSDGDTDLV